jgi:hypothetical protein
MGRGGLLYGVELDDHDALHEPRLISFRGVTPGRETVRLQP